jgi:hypothetical protein
MLILLRLYGIFLVATVWTVKYFCGNKHSQDPPEKCYCSLEHPRPTAKRMSKVLCAISGTLQQGSVCYRDDHLLCVQ